jgi:hypothetical protein
MSAALRQVKNAPAARQRREEDAVIARVHGDISPASFQFQPIIADVANGVAEHLDSDIDDWRPHGRACFLRCPAAARSRKQF